MELITRLPSDRLVTLMEVPVNVVIVAEVELNWLICPLAPRI